VGALTDKQRIIRLERIVCYAYTLLNGSAGEVGTPQEVAKLERELARHMQDTAEGLGT
jgi:hypothetical protein